MQTNLTRAFRSPKQHGFLTSSYIPSTIFFQKSFRPSTSAAVRFNRVSKSLNSFGSSLARHVSRKHCTHCNALSNNESPRELLIRSITSVHICLQTSENDGEPCSIKILKSSTGVTVPTVFKAAFFFAAAWASNDVESIAASSPFSSCRAFFAELKEG